MTWHITNCVIITDKLKLLVHKEFCVINVVRREEQKGVAHTHTHTHTHFN